MTPETIEERRRVLAEMPKINKYYEKTLTVIMAGLQVLIVLLLTVVLATLEMLFVNETSFAEQLALLVLIFGVVAILWSQILFRTKLFDYFFINVKQNWVIVVGNQLKYDDIPPDPDARAKLFERRALREIGQGLRGKWPWEIPVESVNLRSDVLIGSKTDGKPLTCYTSDDVQLDIEWQVILTPLVGFAVYLIRRNEDAIVAYFRGIFEQKIISWVRANTEETVFASLENLKIVFQDTLAGFGHVHHIEMEWGTFTNDPQIFSVNRNPRYQQAAEGKKIAVRVSSIIELLNAQFKDKGVAPDPNLILAAATSIAGNEIRGLLLIPGAGGKEMKEIMASVASVTKAGIKPTGI